MPGVTAASRVFQVCTRTELTILRDFGEDFFSGLNRLHAIRLNHKLTSMRKGPILDRFKRSMQSEKCCISREAASA
jgi:hypothetical protein